ncbi:hypothetical protein B0H14DRAFT_3467752 [Mycena olivaceomarginata]|nr:hypothetical protein B0H14DRAFT_3467752 [Mycena olivaceomarginata]
MGTALSSILSVKGWELCNLLVPDIVADITLATLPITLIRHADIPASQWKMLIVIFAACLLTTLVSIVHAVALLDPGGSLEGASSVLIVANVGILATSAYRLLHKADILDAISYTSSYSMDGVKPTNAWATTNSAETLDQQKSARGQVEGE